MKVAGDYELLESVVVGMDLALEGYGGVLIELARSDDRFVLTETASVTGNRLFRFSSGSEKVVRTLFGAELGKSVDRPAV